MHMDVIDLRDFYSRPMGRVARTLIARRIGEIWPDVRGLNVAGLGFATPYLSPFLGQAERVLGLMPAQQGVLAWPPDGKHLTCLVDEAEIPLPDESMDRILLVHGLEGSEAVRSMMRQIWRVLAPGGRLLIVAPNRRGLWSRREGTPFGIGQPFSRSQLIQLMRENMFSPTRWETALYVPPFQWRPFLRSAGAWEQVGHMLWTRFSGVIMVEAGKQIYAATPQPKRRLARRMRVLAPAPMPQGMQTRDMQTPDMRARHPLEER